MNLIQAFKKFGERITTYIDGVMPKALSEIENDLYYPESKEFLCKITTSNCTYTYDGGDVCIGSHSCDLTEDVVEAINKIGDTYSLYIEYTYNGISGVFNNLTNPDDIYCLLGETSADGCLMLKPRTSGGFYFSQERYQTTAMPFIFSIYLVKNAKTIDSDCVDTTIPRINAAEVGQLVSVKSTDANGVPTEWESVDNFSGSWNDLTDKPFYSEEQETWLLDKTELVYEDTNVRYARISVEAFDVFDVVGNIIKVFWDGTYYDCEILYDETNDHKYIVFDNFTAYLEADTLYITTTDNISETHEFGFFIVDEQLKLDENFIPDIIARTEDIPTEMVMYSEQELTEEQQEQARANIGAASMTEVSALSDTVNDLKLGVDKDTITEAVNDYLVENPVKGGLSTTAVALLMAFAKSCYTSSNQDANLDALEKELLNSSSGGNTGGGTEPDEPTEPDTPIEPDEPTTPTLTSISAVANETTVAVGTKAEDLDITVTAHYSDGTTETITDYSISGTVGAGENTFTIVYGGKTTTVTVIGNALVYSLYNKDMNEGDVDFGVEMNELKSFTVKLDITMNTALANKYVFRWRPSASNNYATWFEVQERSGNASVAMLRPSFDIGAVISGNIGYNSTDGDRHQFVATYNVNDDSCVVYFAETPVGGTMVQKETTGVVDKTTFEGLFDSPISTKINRFVQGDYTINACEISFDYTSAENAKAWFEREV